jgi:hypothetical protein
MNAAIVILARASIETFESLFHVLCPIVCNKGILSGRQRIVDYEPIQQ